MLQVDMVLALVANPRWLSRLASMEMQALGLCLEIARGQHRSNTRPMMLRIDRIDLQHRTHDQSP